MIDLLLILGGIFLVFLWCMFIKALNDIDKCYAAGCTLADPCGVRHRARQVDMIVNVYGTGKPYNTRQKFKDGQGGYFHGTIEEARTYFQHKHIASSISITCSPKKRQY